MRELGYNPDVTRWGALLVFAWVLGACATTGRPEDQPIVDELRIEGTRRVPEADIKKRILTSESSWIPVFGEDAYFDANAWQADLRRIERYYQSQGYYQARVVEDAVDTRRPDHVRLRVRVVEGEPTRIGAVEIRGLEALPPEHRAVVLDDLPLTPGEIFLEEEWVGLKGMLQERLHQLGYATASVTGEVRVDVSTQKAVVELDAVVGRRFKIGRIFVATEPDAKVVSRRVVEQVESVVRPGDWYSNQALLEAQQRVFRMGVFGAVKVNRGAPDQHQGTVPISIHVREAPFHTQRLGVGLGVDQTRQEVRVLGEYTDRNFIGGLRRLTTRGRVGYAFLPTSWDVLLGQEGSKSNVVGDVSAELEQPRFFFRDVSLRTSVQVLRGFEPAYDFLGGRYELGFPWRITSNLTFLPSYNLEAYWLSTPTPLGGRSPALTFGCSSPCVVSYLEQTLEYDRRDDRAEPRDGILLSLSLQEGGGLLGGAFSYLRVLPEARGYYSFDEDQTWTLAGKVRAGTLIPAAGTQSPIISRFFSGGSNMRGFSSRRLSPMLTVPRGRFKDGLVTDLGMGPGETLPIGGDGLLEASLELRWNVTGPLVVAAFGEAGMVSVDSLRLSRRTEEGGRTFDAEFYADNLQYAVGFGVRYRTPVGPIRVDLARRLDLGRPLRVFQNPSRALVYPIYGDCFGLGSFGTSYAGAPESVCAVHLSIGEAF